MTKKQTEACELFLQGYNCAQSVCGAFAQELGMEVVVTDHHQCMPDLPECAAVINPALPDQTYPYRSLCGAGVAFKLVQALGGRDAALCYIDYAAIATLADIVPLTGENRIIVAEGLRRINRGQGALGVKAMLEVSGYGNRAVEAGSVSFSIAPRINAAGRTGSPETALALFLTEDPKEAKKLAEELDGENRRRQAIEAEITKDAMAHIAAGEADVLFLQCGGERAGKAAGDGAAVEAQRAVLRQVLRQKRPDGGDAGLPHTHQLDAGAGELVRRL